MKTSKVTIHTLRQMKERGEKIAMLTAYDATFARLLDEAGADVLLVGDSLGMVVQGHETTLPVTLEEIAYHCRAVVRGARRAHVVGDMPFMSYQASLEQGVTNAGRLMKEGGCHSVKLEGGAVHAELVQPARRRRHPGDGPHRPHAAELPPARRLQGPGPRRRRARAPARRRAHARGGRRLRDRARGDPRRHRARRSPQRSRSRRSASAPAPAATARCSCRYDVLGMDETFKPRFVRRYATLGATIKDAIGALRRRRARGRVPVGRRVVLDRREQGHAVDDRAGAVLVGRQEPVAGSRRVTAARASPRSRSGSRGARRRWRAPGSSTARGPRGPPAGRPARARASAAATRR